MRRHRLEVIVSVVLIMATLAVYWQVQNHEFVNYDDDLYVTDNPHVKAGLTREGAIWAFVATHAGNWHPLTWLSHMLDCEVYGVNPWGHHLTNLLLHIGNTILLFLLFRHVTGAVWRSTLVAALFALHPLHVESVAWVSERKDVLSTLFWLSTMWTYLRHVESPGFRWYLLALLSFALGLMAKPMLVTLPFVLLLIDYWPLGRLQFGQSNRTHESMTPGLQRSSVSSLIFEKVPFFAISAVSSTVTYIVQLSAGAMPSQDVLPLQVRTANALVSYISYIGKMIWPHHLAVSYPHPGSNLPLWQIAGASLLLVFISALVIRGAGRFPYLVVGWLWYLGTLVPVIGLVQVGSQAMADRYTYVPLIGLFVIIVWGAPNLVRRWRHGRFLLVSSSGVLLLTLMACTWLQTSYWKDSFTLFQRTLDVTADNWRAHNGLGLALEPLDGRGRLTPPRFSKGCQHP